MLSRHSATSLLLAAALAHAMLGSTIPGGNGDRGDVRLAQNGDIYEFNNDNVKVTIDGPTATVTGFRFHNTDFINSIGRHNAIYWSMDGGNTAVPSNNPPPSS